MKDACGNSYACGTCQTNEACQNGKCKPCDANACNGKCGSANNGCTTVDCGACANPAATCTNNVCVDPCTELPCTSVPCGQPYTTCGSNLVGCAPPCSGGL